jgi:hypothetical protein
LRIRHQYRDVAIDTGPMGLGWPVAIADVRLPRERARLVQSCDVQVQLILGQSDICRWIRSCHIGDWLLAW